MNKSLDKYNTRNSYTGRQVQVLPGTSTTIKDYRQPRKGPEYRIRNLLRASERKNATCSYKYQVQYCSLFVLRIHCTRPTAEGNLLCGVCHTRRATRFGHSSRKFRMWFGSPLPQIYLYNYLYAMRAEIQPTFKSFFLLHSKIATISSGGIYEQREELSDSCRRL